jgi:hypothetical protein
MVVTVRAAVHWLTQSLYLTRSSGFTAQLLFSAAFFLWRMSASFGVTSNTDGAQPL